MFDIPAAYSVPSLFSLKVEFELQNESDIPADLSASGLVIFPGYARYLG